MRRFSLLALALGLYLSGSSQGKLYIIPTVGFYSGSYSGVDSINEKQPYLKSRKFVSKDFLYALRISFLKGNLGLSLGIENGHYATGLEYYEPPNNSFRVVSREYASQGSILVVFEETKYELVNLNLKKPKQLRKEAKADKQYLIVSRIAPLIGFEFRRMDNTFVQDFPESSAFSTSQGNFSGTRQFHLHNRHHFSMRAGFDWMFYDREKRTFLINFIYSFAFKNAGYFHYRFEPNTPQEFQYRNTTGGNGFSLKVGVPVGIFKKKKL